MNPYRYTTTGEEREAPGFVECCSRVIRFAFGFTFSLFAAVAALVAAPLIAVMIIRDCMEHDISPVVPGVMIALWGAGVVWLLFQFGVLP